MRIIAGECKKKKNQMKIGRKKIDWEELSSYSTNSNIQHMPEQPIDLIVKCGVHTENYIFFFLGMSVSHIPLFILPTWGNLQTVYAAERNLYILFSRYLSLSPEMNEMEADVQTQLTSTLFVLLLLLLFGVLPHFNIRPIYFIFQHFWRVKQRISLSYLTLTLTFALTLISNEFTEPECNLLNMQWNKLFWLSLCFWKNKQMKRCWRDEKTMEKENKSWKAKRQSGKSTKFIQIIEGVRLMRATQKKNQFVCAEGRFFVVVLLNAASQNNVITDRCKFFKLN